jgi:N-acetylglucosamine-6-sulfatase|tara:strand:+ start:691 stop:1416 length:726 start_codon:yes stop_codon:yes gene_type:complete
VLPKRKTTDEYQNWEILSGKGGQGSYFNPKFLSTNGETQVEGHSTEIITDKALDWLKTRDSDRPFLLYAQYKVPHIHRLPPQKHMGSYDDVTFPEPTTLFDDFETRSSFVKDTWMGLKGMSGNVLNIALSKMALMTDPKLTPKFLTEITAAQRDAWHAAYDPRNAEYEKLNEAGLLEGKAGLSYTYQRFIKDYIRCIDGLDENLGRILNYLDESDLAENTIVVYSSDQGFFTGEQGWAEKR